MNVSSDDRVQSNQENSVTQGILSEAMEDEPINCIIETVSLDDSNAFESTSLDMNEENTNELLLTERLSISHLYHKYLIGHKGATLKRLQNKTNTMIYIPNKHNIHNPIVIRAKTREALERAKLEIDSIVKANESKLPYTHFLSIPLANDSIRNSLSQFFEHVSQTYNIDRNVFISPSKFHLTIQMLRLHKPEEINLMKNLLQNEIKQKINELFTYETRQLCVEFEKASTFSHHNKKHADKGMTSVIYLIPKQNELYSKIMQLSRELRNILLQNRLITKKEFEEELTLHATIMNAKYALRSKKDRDKNDENKQEKEKKKHRGFDGNNFLEKFGGDNGSYEIIQAFGEELRIPLTTLELSKLTVAKGENHVNGYYAAEDKIQFFV